MSINSGPPGVPILFLLDPPISTNWDSEPPIHATDEDCERQLTLTIIKNRDPMPVIKHYHHCPVCYEHWKCDANCTIEPDLEDRGKQFGAHCTCPSCDDMIVHEDIFYSSNQDKYDSKEFWDVYNGFVKVRRKK